MSETLIATVIAGAFGGFFNLTLLWLRIFVEAWEAKVNRIPKRTSDFFYSQDFHSSSWGDTFGVTLIDIGIAVLLFESWSFVDWPLIFFAFSIGFGLAAVFQFYSTRPNQKPNSSYPRKGVTSWCGKAHLAYFCIQYSIGVLGIVVVLFNAAEGSFSEIIIPLLVGTFGLSIYLVSLFRDLRDGNFARLAEEKTYSTE